MIRIEDKDRIGISDILVWILINVCQIKYESQ